MARFPPERLILHDERTKALMFEFLKLKEHGAFEFDEMLRLWFFSQESCLVGFLEYLDRYGLEIRKKQ